MLFRKLEDSTRGFKTTVAQVRENFWGHYGIGELKYYKFHNYRNSDFFFSKLVILVESTNDAEILKQLLLQKELDLDDYPVSVINVDGVDSLKYPLFLLRELEIPDLIILDKDFFVPYAHDSLDESRYESGFPKYKNEFKTKNIQLINFLIDNATYRPKLLRLLKANHSRALDLLEEYNLICMKHSLEIDLIASDKGAQLFYEKLHVPDEQKNKKTLLVDRKNQIKQLENLKYVVENLPHSNLPNSYKRVKKFASKLVKETV